jgi:lipopolysaccharide export system protein LptC
LAVNALQQSEEFAQPLAAADPARPVDAAPPHRRADVYSRIVTLLKRLLPAIGACLLLLVALWPRLSPLIDNMRLAIGAIDLREARELKMIHPHYAGTDRLNRPYVVTAAVGRQMPNRSDLMSLEKPHAVMIVHGGASVVLTAKSAVYQSQPQLLDLFDDVTLTHQNGTRFVTQRAHANLVDSTAQGDDPIEGHGPQGDVWGQGFRVRDRGNTIDFTGRSHAILKSTNAVKPATPPVLPPAVVETAALVEAAVTAPTDPPRAPAPAPAPPAAGAAAAAPAPPATGASAATPAASAQPVRKLAAADASPPAEPVAAHRPQRRVRHAARHHPVPMHSRRIAHSSDAAPGNAD